MGIFSKNAESIQEINFLSKIARFTVEKWPNILKMSKNMFDCLENIAEITKNMSNKVKIWVICIFKNCQNVKYY